MFDVIKKFVRFVRKDKMHDLREFAIGLNSNISSDSHIIFLDYDTKAQNMAFVEVEYDIRELIRHFDLSDAEIFQTHNGYHCFWWYDHVPYSRLKMIINYSRCDPMFKYISKFYNYKTIRAAGKYQELDIMWYKVVKGQRSPSPKEVEIGGLKRKEYFGLRKIHESFVKENLKEN
jgi:hypothetical protein